MEINTDHHCTTTTTTSTATTISDVLHFLANAGVPAPTNNAQYFLAEAVAPQPSGDKVKMMKMMMAMMDSSSPPVNYVSSGGDEMMGICNCVDDGGNGNVRWPRQETLTLLEIRSRLDHKFKEATQKAPLWTEVSRIMAEEYGYQRSGKKCKEKFENLYKYYKKTKAGKVGRSEGKNYRFFRQLEALYGGTSNPVSVSNLQFTQNISNNVSTFNEKPSDQLTSTSLNSSELETSSSECQQNGHIISSFMDTNGNTKMSQENEYSGRRGEKKKWKMKAGEFIASEMKRVFGVQEAWFDRMVTALEHKEQEMQSRREKWRRREAERHEEECRFWANEHAWIKTRYILAADMLQKFMVKDLEAMDADKNIGNHDEIGREIATARKHNHDEDVEGFVGENAHCRKHGEHSKTSNIQQFGFVLNRGHKALELYPNFDGFCSNANEGIAAHASESCFQHLMN